MVYLSLDGGQDGTPVGPDQENISFLPGWLGNAIHFPNENADLQAYYEVGFFPPHQYCFPEPELCNSGVTFAFWLSLLGTTDTTAWQGFITTTIKNGPGFVVYFHDGNLVFQVHFYTVQSRFTTANPNFPANFSRPFF